MVSTRDLWWIRSLRTLLLLGSACRPPLPNRSRAKSRSPPAHQLPPRRSCSSARRQREVAGTWALHSAVCRHDRCAPGGLRLPQRPEWSRPWSHPGPPETTTGTIEVTQAPRSPRAPGREPCVRGQEAHGGTMELRRLGRQSPDRKVELPMPARPGMGGLSEGDTGLGVDMANLLEVESREVAFIVGNGRKNKKNSDRVRVFLHRTFSLSSR